MQIDKFLPPIRIHCWGGFGSQLYALSVCNELGKRSGRRLILTFHTGGVTRRIPEILELLTEIEYVIVDDFERAKNAHQAGPSNLRKTLRQLVKRALTYVGVLTSLDKESDFNQLPFWVMQIRGHYANLPVSTEFFVRFFSQYVPKLTENVKSTYIGIHYRLGDLLTLSNKEFIAPARMVKILQTLKESRAGGSLDVLISSDSINFATELLGRGLTGYEVSTTSNDGTILEEIARLIQSDIFIGTNSKVSSWVSLIRLHLVPGSTNYLPQEMKVWLDENFYEYPRNSVVFY